MQFSHTAVLVQFAPTRTFQKEQAHPLARNSILQRQAERNWELFSANHSKSHHVALTITLPLRSLFLLVRDAYSDTTKHGLLIALATGEMTCKGYSKL
jgi:hypothetical protein